MWVRGLKPQCRLQDLCRNSVAPYVGAWIETCKVSIAREPTRVAPYVGAWIETYGNDIEIEQVESHPMWVRGLKHGSGSGLCEEDSRTLCGCVD